MRSLYFIPFFYLLLFSPTLVRGQFLVSGDWPQFRGIDASGVATGCPPPVTWDVEGARNIAWKTEIPGLGLASPIIVGEQVFIVTAVGDEQVPSLRTGLYGDIESVADEGVQSWQVYSLSLRTGKVIWKRILYTGQPTMNRHTKSSHANATPASDGEHIVVNLASEGLYCLSTDGGFRWKKRLGKLDSGYYRDRDAQWGYASSPIVFQQLAIVLADIQERSFLAAYDLRTGCERWRTDRDDVPTWGTPTIVRGASFNELVINGYRHSGGYDPATGHERWRLDGGGDIPVPTPIEAHGLIYLSSGHGENRPLRAIKVGSQGNIGLQDGDATSESVVWTHPRDGIYLQTPIVYGPHLYACRGNGVLSCYDARTGQRLYRERLGGGGGFTASPIAADGKLYFISEEGEVYVVRAGPEYELLAKNVMGEICLATPAISGGVLVVRTKGHVFGITQKTDNDRFFHVDSITGTTE
ncbi:MAG: PQQ-like beta-propeller repeat protein [Planctomycetaceae bacterium]|nr:PQQ-like beta-propeller repeat protein [Planctomycetaceae bacterium]